MQILRPLREVRAFRSLFAASMCSFFGDWLDLVAIQLLLIYTFGLREAALATLFVMVSVPVVFAPLVGVWVDRLPTRHLMVAMNLVMAGLTCWIVVAPSAWVVFGLVACRGLAASVFQAAEQSSLKAVVPQCLLAQANAANQFGVNFPKILGPALGAPLLVVMSPSAVIAVNAGTYILAAALLWFSAIPSEVPTTGNRHWLHDLRAGATLLSTNGDLRALMVARLPLESTMLAVNSMIALAAMNSGLTKSEFSLYVTVVGIGGVTGALVMGQRFSGQNSWRAMAIAVALSAPTIGAIGLFSAGVVPGHLAAWMVCGALTGAFMGAFRIAMGTLILHQTPAASMGRVATAFSALTSIGTAIGALSGWAISAKFGLPWVYWASAIIMGMWAAAVLATRAKQPDHVVIDVRTYFGTDLPMPSREHSNSAR